MEECMVLSRSTVLTPFLVITAIQRLPSDAAQLTPSELGQTALLARLLMAAERAVCSRATISLADEASRLPRIRFAKLGGDDRDDGEDRQCDNQLDQSEPPHGGWSGECWAALQHGSPRILRPHINGPPRRAPALPAGRPVAGGGRHPPQFGGASCRAEGCRAVRIAGVAGCLQK